MTDHVGDRHGEPRRERGDSNERGRVQRAHPSDPVGEAAAHDHRKQHVPACGAGRCERRPRQQHREAARDAHREARGDRREQQRHRACDADAPSQDRCQRRRHAEAEHRDRQQQAGRGAAEVQVGADLVRERTDAGGDRAQRGGEQQHARGQRNRNARRRGLARRRGVHGAIIGGKYAKIEGAVASRTLSPLFLRSARPSRLLGLLVALAGIAVETALIYPLAHVANVASLGVVYLFAVVLVSTYWGFALGLLTAIASAAAFNFFHLPPVGRLTLADTATGSRWWPSSSSPRPAGWSRTSRAPAQSRPTAAGARPISRASSPASCSPATRPRRALAVATAAPRGGDRRLLRGNRARRARRRRAPDRVRAAQRGPADRNADPARDGRGRGSPTRRRAHRPGARVAARGRAQPCDARGGGRRDGGAASQRRAQDGAAAFGLPRSAHAAYGDPQRDGVA